MNEKGTLREVKGDVRNPQISAENEIAIIPHCCNNLGVMGAGVALALKKKWPEVFEIYDRLKDLSPNGWKNRLGEICYTPPLKADNGQDVIVVNMIGQDGIANAANAKPVKYWALQQCMNEIMMVIAETKETARRLNLPEPKPVIHTPKFGAALAGGNWDFILELIQEQWLDRGIDVVVYEFGAIAKPKDYYVLKIRCGCEYDGLVGDKDGKPFSTEQATLDKMNEMHDDPMYLDCSLFAVEVDKGAEIDFTH
jgi:hypothetical protein